MIEILAVSALPACLDLAADRGWEREERKWRLLFDIATVYGIRDDDGALIGSATLTRFGGTAAVGMLLVAGRHGGRGLGRRLMERVLADAGDDLVFLTATAHGRPLYEKLGFRQTGMVHLQRGVYTPDTGAPITRPATAADVSAVDTAVTGADRGPMVSRLPDFADRLRVVRDDTGTVTGYGGIWPNTDHAQIGPLAAASDDDAIALIRELAADVSGVLRVDIDGRHPAVREWAAARGIVEFRQIPIMTLHGRKLPGDRDRYYVPLMLALG